MKSKRNPEVVITASICFGLVVMVLWVYYSVVFAKKQPEQKKEISVVLYDAGEDGWESLLEGMKQAEEDFSVRLNYIIAKQGTSKEEQAELVLKEIKNGAAGILLAAGDAEIVLPEIWSGTLQTPVVAVESSADAANDIFFSADNAQMGQMLGRTVLSDFAGKDELKIVVIEEYLERNSVRERKRGLYEVLENQAQVIPIQRINNEVELSMYLSNVLVRTEADAIVALNKETLQVLCEMDVDILKEKKIYGIGNTPSIVAALEKGKIQNLVFQDEFNIGYMSVKALTEQIEGIQIQAEDIDFYSVYREDVHQMPYERLLFPMVE